MPNPVQLDRRSPKRDFEAVRARFPMWPLVLAEGDSWFAHPLLTNVLYHLHREGGFAIRRIASAGDTLRSMVREIGGRPEYVRRLDSNKDPYRLLLLSAGGNDILGDHLENVLRDRRAVASWEETIDPVAWGMVLAQVRGDYQLLIQRTAEIRPGCQIVAHGYDYPFPRPEGAKFFWATVAGPWILPVMEARHVVDHGEQRQILERLIDDFHDKVLIPLRDETPSFHLVDVRGTLARVEQWDDEIHPTSDGFGAIADAFRREMKRLTS